MCLRVVLAKRGGSWGIYPPALVGYRLRTAPGAVGSLGRLICPITESQVLAVKTWTVVLPEVVSVEGTCSGQTAALYGLICKLKLS